MQSSVKAVLLAMSITAIVITFVFGSVTPVLAQTVPTTTNLEKRDYSYYNDLHATARFGNNKVCGDHLCASGEWAKLQGNLNQAQITHTQKNTTKTISMPSSTTMTASGNTTQIPSQPVPPTPAPIPTPPSGPSSVCISVKAVLGNSGVPTATITKIMSDLGCNN